MTMSIGAPSDGELIGSGSEFRPPNPALDSEQSAIEAAYAIAIEPTASYQERELAIAQLAATAREMARRAYTDSLTGLPNGWALADHLSFWRHRVASASSELPPEVPEERRLDDRLALMSRQGPTIGMVDFDNFKRGNDTLGHDTMDSVLREVSFAFARLCREQDVLYRTGGDELTFVFSSGMQTMDDIAKFRVRMDEVVEDILVSYPVLRRLRFGISFGVVNFNSGLHRSIEDLRRAADLAMYEEKLAKRAARAEQLVAEGRQRRGLRLPNIFGVLVRDPAPPRDL